MDSYKRHPVPDVNLVINHWSDHYDSGVDYQLEIGDTRISLKPDVAEKVMLATGIGQLVWFIDWPKVGGHETRSAIIPRIKTFVPGFEVFNTKEEAEARVAKEIQNRIDALQKHLK